MQRVLNMETITPDKELNTLIYRTLCYIVINRCYKLLKVFVPPYISQHDAL